MDKKDQIIEELRKENIYLKELLNQNNISFDKPKEITQFALSDNEKIQAYLSYFVGRDDIFAYQYINKEGKKQFSPACKGRANLTGFCGGICNECTNKKYIGITEADIKRHLIGKDIFGIYPLLKNDTCQLLAIDFDDKDFKECALAYSNVCKKHKLDSIIEISSSGCGAHVWMFFKNPIKASKARRLGTHLIYETMDQTKGINFDSLDRMFPSQDFAPIHGYGNLIVLPLQGEKAKSNRTVFVDNNFVPYELKNQINALLNIRKITEEEIDVLLNEFKESESFSLLNKNILKNLKINRNDFAKQITIIKQNEIVIPKVALNDRSAKFFYRLGSLPNPNYYEAQRQRRSVYNIPMIQKLYWEDESFIYLPRGCFDDVIKVLNYLGIEINLIDKQTQGELIPISFKGKLKDYQQDGLEKLIKSDNGLFVAPPAYGKTVTAIALIGELKLNTLVVVPSIALLNQWIKRLDEFLDIGYEYRKERDKFGQYYGSKKKLTGKIDIASIDSLLGEEAEDVLKRYGIVIFDEVHHIAASSYEQVVRKCFSKYLYGFTATPKRSDKNEKIVYKTIGEIKYQFKDDINDLIKILKPEFTFFSFNSLEKTLPYSEMLSVLLKDEDRNNKIINDLFKSYKQGKNIIVLTDRIEHINILKEKLSSLQNVFVINGQLSRQEREQFFINLESINNSFIILSTGKYIGEGFDEKKLNTLFLVSPFRWSGTLEQYVGRLHRNHNKKINVEVHDYIDINVGLFENMYHERLRGYRKLGYVIDSEEILFEKKIYCNTDYRIKMLDDIRSAKTSIDLLINSFEEEALNEILNAVENTNVYIHSESEIIHKSISSHRCEDTGINAVVIDNKILWYGGINPFKTANYYDSIMRINDKSVIESFVKEISKE